MDSEEHIFRLNKKIKELIALYEKSKKPPTYLHTYE